MEEVPIRAREAGIRRVVTSGMDLKSSARAVEIAAANEDVLASVGIHPWIAAEHFPFNFLEEIRQLAREDVTVAMGEVGLDFVDNVSTGVTYHDNQRLREAQERALRTQVESACEAGLPLILHCRGAYASLGPILREEKAYRVRGVVHNFDSDTRTASELLDMGFFLSFGGTITYPEATGLRRTLCRLPLEGILIETDSPYMPLHLQPTEKNEPANVARIVQRVAEIRKVDFDELANTIYTNFCSLLNVES
jgi:TatD DNase family protein